ncbi:MAG: hypothetical protein GTN80_00400 [Nitrososphaeria archaeon]|nr:hypothetical protein [Nitrososphaeria archaeon]NIN51620.1 hypothetical protein [Nitrososphaeria archaeon]NIQ32105.1 hypothetical protein [Nitrososphaeria archaeon]
MSETQVETKVKTINLVVTKEAHEFMRFMFYYWNGREPENQEELERFIYAKLMRELLTDICEDDPNYVTSLFLESLGLTQRMGKLGLLF